MSEPIPEVIEGPRGQTGVMGPWGKSAYEVWLDEGHQGTEQDYLDSNVGERGPIGPKGIDGTDGNDGDPGPRGLPGGLTESSTVEVAEAVADTLLDPGSATNAQFTSLVADAAAQVVPRPGFAAGPTARFLARLMRRNVEPVVVLAMGTSQVEGIADNEWPHMLSDLLQAAFPLSSGDGSPAIRTLAQYATNPELSAGVQVINAGVSGSTASTMLPGANQTNAEALAPYVGLFIIDTGTNDKQTGVSPATFETELLEEITPVRAAAGVATWLLVHGNDRLSYGSSMHPANWDEYRAVKQAYVAAHPEDSMLLDLSEVFRSLGIGLGMTDPLDFLQDEVHFNAYGNQFYFEAVVDALRLPRGGTSEAAAPVPTGTWEPAYSDAFTGADDTDIHGRTFDNTLGGTQTKTWVNSPAGSVAMAGGNLTKGAVAGNFFAGESAASDHVRLEFTVDVLPTYSSGTTGLSVAIARLTGLGGAVYGVSMTIANTGVVTLLQRDSAGSASLVSGAIGTAAAGDTFVLERKGLALRVLQNGALIATAVLSTELAATRFQGFVAATTTITWQVSNVKVYDWVEPA